MGTLKRIVYASLLLFIFPCATLFAACNGCCSGMLGIQYCDFSAGRYVCGNGAYSSCYCTIHAIMDLQKIQGCCLWQGGVLKIDELGLVICRDMSISEACSLQLQAQQVSM